MQRGNQGDSQLLQIEPPRLGHYRQACGLYTMVQPMTHTTCVGDGVELRQELLRLR
jgi:hypothetical protein